MVNPDDHSDTQLSDRYSAEHISDEDEPKKGNIHIEHRQNTHFFFLQSHS